MPSETEKSVQTPLRFSRWATIRRVGLYLGSKALMIAVTIFLGVFVTVVIANHPAPPGWFVSEPQIESNIRIQIERYVRSYQYEHPDLYALPLEERDAVLNKLRAELAEDAGMNLPYWPRHLVWTLNALRFDWGEITVSNLQSLPVYGQTRTQVNISSIILQYFPNTVLLAATANLLVFLLGIPLALFLARTYGSRVDRFFSILAPVSSIPSWVIGILFISLFAVELRWLPSGGMFDRIPPETAIGYVPIVFRHMILPVLAIFFSLFFQLVYFWRTFFVIYAEEDYVDLAIAKGLPHKRLEQNYILKPTLTYVITSFSLTLVGFWQMTMVLEVVFDWPGIGWLYVTKALPNFWGESMYPGELLAAIGVVVIFAYMLGATVFLLEIVYVLVDPRVQFSGAEPTMRFAPARRGWFHWLKRKQAPGRLAAQGFDGKSHLRPKRSFAERARAFGPSLRIFLRDALTLLGRALREIRRYPSAIFGLSVVLVLVAGSVYAVIALPYEEIGTQWSSGYLAGKPNVPSLAEPSWTNLFRPKGNLSVLVLDSRKDPVERTVLDLGNGTTLVSLEMTLDYEYGDFPREMYLYIDGKYAEKKPFVSGEWTTPDERKFSLKGVSAGYQQKYDFAEMLPYKRLVTANEHWQKWFEMGQVFPTPPHYILFADPLADAAKHLNGTYHLRLDALSFEPDGDIEAELVLLGQVYGLAGTDYLRRDLVVPLLWGMPFALAFGLGGAVLTTVLSMILAATGVWLGGWMDNLIQRVTEANMVLPVLAIGVLAYALFGISIITILAVIVLLNVFGSPTKTFRSAFLQIKDASYIEAARAYGASNVRIIMNYMVPRIIPVLVPQLITLIPNFVFLEATLGLFNIKSIYPTWGTIIYQGLARGALYGSRYWVLEPLSLLLLTGLAFAMLGFALERILNPRLLEK